jgi:uncharacterized membrane protein YjjP (DUF1212 family)
MTLAERASLLLAFAKVLFVNGQSTDRTLIAAERLGRTLGVEVEVMPRWGDLQIIAKEGETRVLVSASARPVNVHMHRVAAAGRMIEDVVAGRLAPASALNQIAAVSEIPPSPTWLFALAAAAGAVALAEIFGMEHLATAVLVFLSAGAGAMLRRGLAHFSSNVFLQPFCAALLAGIVGGLAVHFDVSSSLRLIAVCPCMVLVPGPPVLNGALDLFRGRIVLGAARLIFAGLVVAAISAGLLLGLALFHADLPVEGASRAVPVWFDVIAAGIAVAAYSIFFSTPREMLPWPIGVGMAAHALRWFSLTALGWSAAMGAFAACLVVGLILTPVARRTHMPFAAIGFAAVVSMIPGVFLFRMASGLAQIANGANQTAGLASATANDALTAGAVILAMSFGLLVPKLAIDHFGDQPR